MKRYAIAGFLLLFSSLVWTQERVIFSREQSYDPFYDMEVELADGEVISLTAAAFHTMEDEQKYFFWIRRGTETGVVTYALELNRIKEIQFTDLYGKPENDYTPARITLTNGESYDIFMDTLGYLGGFDAAFGSYGRLFMHYNLVKRITFRQDGSYFLCPHCGTVYYTTGLEKCPFDNTTLIPAEGNPEEIIQIPLTENPTPLDPEP
ncbi:MAG: hypothetical protein PQJ59_06505 [Spirochaetales bacterium]|nr:hypothetical protein [Spirochaetales bacterium]